MTEIQSLCESVFMQLMEIKQHICNGRDFEAGVGLGSLISSLICRKDSEEEKRNEKIQDQEIDQECEEGEEEEDYCEDSFYTEYLNQQRLNIELEEKIERFKDLEKKLDQMELTKKAIFDLQDLVMRLIKFKKIDEMEWPNVFNILRNTGVEKGDIEVLCNFKMVGI